MNLWADIKEEECILRLFNVLFIIYDLMSIMAIILCDFAKTVNGDWSVIVLLDNAQIQFFSLPIRIRIPQLRLPANAEH